MEEERDTTAEFERRILTKIFLVSQLDLWIVYGRRRHQWKRMAEVLLRLLAVSGRDHWRVVIMMVVVVVVVVMVALRPVEVRCRR